MGKNPCRVKTLLFSAFTIVSNSDDKAKVNTALMYHLLLGWLMLN